MGQTFASNNRECFGLGPELPRKTAEGEEEGDEGTENEHPPGHPLYKPKAFKPAAAAGVVAATAASAARPAQPANAADFKPFLSPRYHLHLNLGNNDAVPYGAHGAQVEACQQCLLIHRHPPTMIELDVCMCKRCWDEGTDDLRHVVRHRNGVHGMCPKDYPPSELSRLPNLDPALLAHWRAEWRHTHGDHELCRPHYLFGCSQIEMLQCMQVQHHQSGDHSKCPKEFPIYMLKPSASPEGAEQMQDEEADELSEATKDAWRAHWQHEHGEHALCRAAYKYGCESGTQIDSNPDTAAAATAAFALLNHDGRPDDGMH